MEEGDVKKLHYKIYEASGRKEINRSVMTKPNKFNRRHGVFLQKYHRRLTSMFFQTFHLKNEQIGIGKEVQMQLANKMTKLIISNILTKILFFFI